MMKKKRMRILAFLTAMMLVSGLFNYQVFAKDNQSQKPMTNESTNETIEEISEEEFIEALAKDRNITYDEAKTQVYEKKAHNPYLQMRGPLYKQVYQTRSLTRKGPNGVNLLARVKVSAVIETATAKTIEFGDIILTDVRTSGTGSFVRFSGEKAAQKNSKTKITMFVLGEVYVDISRNISISGGELIHVSAGASGTLRYKWLVDETFTFYA